MQQASKASIHVRRIAVVALLISAGVMVWLVTRGLKVGTQPHVDFFDFYYAAQAVPKGLDIYAVGDPGYIYPPLLAFLMQPLAWLEPVFAAQIWVGVNAILAAALCWLCVDTATKLLGVRWHWSKITLACCVVFWILADGFRNELEWGNCNFLIMLGVVLGIRWLHLKPALAGACLAVAAALKYLPILFLLYLIARGSWRSAASMCVVLVALLLMPAIQVGWHRNVEFLGSSVRGVSTMLASKVADPARFKDSLIDQSAPTAPANIWPMDADFSFSIPSGIARVVRDTHAPKWAVACGILGVAALCIAICAAIYRRNRQRLWWFFASVPKRTPAWLVTAEAIGVSTAMVVFSPQAQKRHFNMLIPLIALAVVLAIAAPTRVRAWTVVGLVILAILATPMINTPWTRDFFVNQWEWFGGPSYAILACQFITLAMAFAYFRVHVVDKLAHES